MGEGQREYLVCDCGWVHAAALPGEAGRESCVRCGRPSKLMNVASEKMVEGLPMGCTVSIVKWP